MPHGACRRDDACQAEMSEPDSGGGGIAMRLVPLLLASLVVAASLSTPGRAADGTPTHIRGTVQSLDGQALVVASRDGPVVTVLLAKDVKVSTLAKVDLAAIKAGDFIGTAAVSGTDGWLHAQEILIFPEALRGAWRGAPALGPDAGQHHDQRHRRRG